MILTKRDPFSESDLKPLSEEFDGYIKTVIDVERKICSAGANRHFENEAVLLDQDSDQANLWGGGVDLKTKTVDFNSMINIRPAQNNTSNEIQDPEVRQEFESQMKYFFEVLWKN